MEEYKKQNASLMITTLEEDGANYVTYIPLHVDENLLDEILRNGQSENRNSVYFKIDCNNDTFWKDMWDNM